MAEGLAVAGSVLAIVQLASSTVKLIEGIRSSSSPKIEEAYWLAVAERETTLAWARKLQFSGRPIPPENTNRVEGLLEQLRTRYNEIDKSLKTLHGPGSKKLTVRVMRERAFFLARGFDDVKERLSAINAMNRALVALAPMLPEYEGSQP